MLPEYAGICGITKEELQTQMSADVEALGEKLGKTKEETLEALQRYYDGPLRWTVTRRVQSVQSAQCHVE